MMHKVFVYGSLKIGYSNHVVLRGADYVGEDTTADPAWYMFSMGGFPGVVRGDKLITGEVYEVDDEGLSHLDALEGNGSFYTREVIPLKGGGDAWMYVLPDGRPRDPGSGVSIKGNEMSWLLT